MEASDDSGMMEAGRSSEPEPKSQASHEEVKVRFSREKYDKYAKRQDMPLKGLSLMPINGLDAVSEKWPGDRKTQSKNPYVLRGLAVNYFYQSRMSKARELLLKVWDCIEDLDTALMLAECACAVPSKHKDKSGQEETVTKAIQRVCIYVKRHQRITSGLIDEWNDQVKKSGRFMGYVTLQYAWYCRFKEYNRERIVDARHLVYDVIKKITLNLLEVRHKLTTSNLTYVFIYILKRMMKRLKVFDRTTRKRKHAYVKALCCNARAYLYMQCGNLQRAYDDTCIGARGMEVYYGEKRKERILYGDLSLNRAVAKYGLSKGQNEDHLESFSEALSVYLSAAEKHITGSDRKRWIELVHGNMRQVLADVHG